MEMRTMEIMDTMETMVTMVTMETMGLEKGDLRHKLGSSSLD